MLGRRPDGYHEVSTVYQNVSLADELYFKPAPERMVLTSTGFKVPLDGSNLVARAAGLLAVESGKGAEIHLVKRIPPGGGLGGGSADAAASLEALNELWGLGLPADELNKRAALLGSDVPFFLMGGRALGRGRGELLQRLSSGRPFHLVLVYPGFQVSSAEAYGLFAARQVRVAPGSTGTRESGSVMKSMLEALQSGEPGRLAGELINDLEQPVISRYPEIGAVREALLAAGALGARMTGSGSCVFGIARDGDHALEIRSLLDPAVGRSFVLHTTGAGIERMKTGGVPGEKASSDQA